MSDRQKVKPIIFSYRLFFFRTTNLLHHLLLQIDIVQK